MPHESKCFLIHGLSSCRELVWLKTGDTLENFRNSSSLNVYHTFVALLMPTFVGHTVKCITFLFIFFEQKLEGTEIRISYFVLFVNSNNRKKDKIYLF